MKFVYKGTTYRSENLPSNIPDEMKKAMLKQKKRLEDLELLKDLANEKDKKEPKKYKKADEE